ncbi:Myb-like_DNA-binding domain-containing protein [Hexamita inflata]|uniref:Myb-like_DNA-binding domain-containing protein n=1 Tax=Hexamita inflata TaxID=28002 RepID=A0ABP1HFT4_9EUKA
MKSEPYQEWSQEDISILIQLVENYTKDKQVPNWTEIQKQIPTKTIKSCQNKYWALIKKQPTIKQVWTKEDEIKLMKLHKKYEDQWELIQKEFPEVTADQIRAKVRRLLLKQQTNKDQDSQTKKPSEYQISQQLKQLLDF